MESSAADRLLSLLGLFEGPDVARTRRLVEQTRHRDPETDVVVVALVGPSGVGKSYLVNAWAGAPVAPSSVFRPTTAEPLAVGSVVTERLHGFAAVPGGSTASPGIVLVDTPPWEYDSVGVDAVLDVTDVALLVVSPSRYADAATAAAAARVASRGIVLSVACNRLPPDGTEIVAAAADLMGRDVPVVVPETLPGDAAGVESLRTFLDSLSADRSRVLLPRREGAVADVAGAVEPISVAADDRRRAEADAAAAVRGRLELARVDRVDLVPAAALDWPDAASHIAALVDSAVKASIAGPDGADSASEEQASHIDRSAASLRPADPTVFDGWQADVTEASVEKIRPRWLRWLRRGAVTDEAWRLVLDFDRMPSRRVRSSLGDRLPGLRESGNAAIEPFVATAVASASAGFLAALDEPSTVSGDSLREAAIAFAADAGQGGFALDATPGVQDDG